MSRPSVTRRNFLKGSLMSLSGAVIQPALSGLGAAARRLRQRLPWYTQPQQVTYNYCDICPWRCGIAVTTVEGRIVKIEGNPNDPKSRGRLCARGQAGVSYVYDPDRLKQPLIRTGERGEGKFRTATWEEALDYTAEKLLAIKDKYGPEAVAFLGHTSGDFWFADYFAQAWGSPNASKPSMSLCTSPREEAATLTIGRAIGNHEPVDWDETRCVVLLGTHIGEDARNTMMQDLANARENGAKLIVIDPRYSSVAMKADAWLQIKPGTDTALLLAWMNVLITEGLIDQEFIANWTVGFDQLVAHVADKTPEWAAAITDLSADQIRATARVFGAARPASVIVPGRHVVWYGNDTQRLRAVYMLTALVGGHGRPGGQFFNKTPFLDAYPHPPFQVAGSSGGCGAAPGEESAELSPGPTGKVRADGVREKFLRGATAMQELIEPMLTGQPYPIKGLVSYGTNVLHTIPNVPRTIEALKALDLVLTIDILPQDHVAWSDVVFPEATYLERHDELWGCGHKTPYVTIREPAIQPLYDTKPGWWMARELGMRVGLEKWFAWQTAEEYLDRRLSSLGLSMAKMHEQGGVTVQKGKPYLTDFEADGTSPFGTPSGKVELYSEALAEAGHAPMPEYEPTPDGPAGFFRLLYGRSPVHTFARTQNTPVLHHLMPENAVWINDATAAELGFADGERVMLENQDGVRSGPVPVKATPRIRKDCVYMVHGFGHNTPDMKLAHGKGASDAMLQTKYVLDPISGGAGMRVNFVKLVKGA